MLSHVVSYNHFQHDEIYSPVIKHGVLNNLHRYCFIKTSKTSSSGVSQLVTSDCQRVSTYNWNWTAPPSLSGSGPSDMFVGL